jgi:hypothetical protein
MSLAKSAVSDSRAQAIAEEAERLFVSDFATQLNTLL